ncbi:MAG: S49 family peptidase [Nitratireductor sp.]|nr:S49 family peptidase [Nitratireductor sp.]MCC0020642.1 S49 family peptidase [Nitratireductor sp.]
MKISGLIPARLRKDVTVIPVVRLHGTISASNSPFSRNMNMATVASQLQRAFEMKQAPVVAISINSPGGSPVQSRLIYSRIRELAAEHGKKVLVFVEDVAASGGYMIALAGDEIIADETSIVGSIGVVAAGFGFVEAIGKLGVERRVYTAGKNKVTLDPFLPEKKSDVDHLKKLQLDIHDIFISMVKERRGAKLAEDDNLFSGQFWTGRPAKELGLVDGFGHMSSELKKRYGKKTKLVLMQAKRNLFGRPVPSVAVAAGAPGGIGGGLGGGVGGEIARELPAGLVEEANERAMWARYGL